MKTYLFSGYRFMQTVIWAYSLILSTSLYYAQNKVYADSQGVFSEGLCVGCTYENPSNAVGSNEDNYSTLKIPLGIANKLGQVLYFPASAKLSKLVIGIGTGNSALSIALLNGVTVELMNGNDIYYGAINIGSNLLKISTQDPQRGIIELPYITVPYDRVRITLNSGLLTLNDEFRIYYAYRMDIPICSSPPNPLLYYPFNGNTTDTVSGVSLHTVNNSPAFKNNQVCNQGLGPIPLTDQSYNLQSPPMFTSIPTTPKTISFWARVDAPEEGFSPPFFNLEAFGRHIKIRPDSARLGYSADSPFDLVFPITPGKFNFYTMVFDREFFSSHGATRRGKVCLYINGQPGYISDPIDLQKNCIYWLGFPIAKEYFEISVNGAQLDELVLYDRVLPPLDIQVLYNSYNIPVSPVPSTNKGAITHEILTVTPNPTTGQITLDGSVLLVDSDISVRNISGKEVYHSKFISKTFDLPYTLPGGVYILTLQTKDKKVYTRKIILTR